MSEWKECKLGDVVSKLGDGLHGTPKYDDNGEYYFINGNNLGNGKIIIKESTKRTTAEEYNKYKKDLNDKTILVSINGTLGNVGLYNNEKCFLGKSACYFNVKEDVDKLFIKYVVTNNNFQEYINVFANGTTIKNVSLKTMREYPFLLPSLPEQKAIALVLSSLDDKIDLLNRQNKTLESMAETLFRQWFDNYEIKDHTLINLKDLVKQIKPGTNYQPKRIESGIPFLNVRNLSNGFIDKSDIKYISAEEYSRVHKVWKPEENDILISRIGTLGVVALIRSEDLPIAVHYNMLNVKAEKTSYQFLYYLFKSKYFQIKYNNIIRVSVQEYVAVEDVELIGIPIPSSNEQMHYLEDVLNSLFEKSLINYNQIRTLEKLRDSLLPKLMSGEVRVEV